MCGRTKVFERTSIYLMPVLILRRNIIVKHLNSLEYLYDVIRSFYTSYNTSEQNHCITELSYPSVSDVMCGINFYVAEELCR